MLRTFSRHWPVVALTLLAACATAPAPSEEGARLIAEGKVEEGLALMQQAAKAHPDQKELYTSYLAQRSSVTTLLVRDADRMRSLGELDGAQAYYASVLRMDPQSDLARAGLAAVARARVHQARVREGQQALQAGDLPRAEQIVRSVLAEDPNQREARVLAKNITELQANADGAPPRLREALQRPVSLELRDVPLSTIFEILSKTGDINFVIDREVKIDARSSVFVRDSSIEDVLKILLVTNQLERKVLNGNSLLVYPATQGKQREYQELVVRSFYVANADAKQTAAMIKAMVKTRDVFVDEKLNLVIMRDTPEAVRLAEQLVATQDLGEPEVMLDLEVLEVSSTLIKDLGIQYPGQITINGVAANGTISDAFELGAGGRLRAFVANPVLLLNLSKSDGSTNILANPRIRVKNREKAHVHIGERVPVITTTSTANVGVSSSVNYLETGLKLDVEPNVFLEQEVAIKVTLEVSNILEQLNVSGTVAYRLGTRNAATTLRLRDGETQVLAGLISNEDRKTVTGVPYASDMPVLGRLFRTEDTRGSKTEIVLLVTPHIVRNVTRPDLVRPQFPSGTEAVPGAPPLRIGNAGRLVLSAGTGGPAVATSTGPGAGPDLQVSVTAPAEAKIGSEISLAMSLPGGSDAATASVRVTYDPAVLKPIGLAPAPGSINAPDQAQVVVDVASSGVAGLPPTPTQVRFQVIAPAPTSTELDLLVERSSRKVNIPRTLNVAVVK